MAVTLLIDCLSDLFNKFLPRSDTVLGPQAYSSSRNACRLVVDKDRIEIDKYHQREVNKAAQRTHLSSSYEYLERAFFKTWKIRG